MAKPAFPELNPSSPFWWAIGTGIERQQQRIQSIQQQIDDLNQGGTGYKGRAPRMSDPVGPGESWDAEGIYGFRPVPPYEPPGLPPPMPPVGGELNMPVPPPPLNIPTKFVAPQQVTRSAYADSDWLNGYRPQAGEQGVIVDFANHMSEPLSNRERRARSDFRGEYLSQASRASEDFARNGVQFPIETLFPRVAQNIGMAPFTDPPDGSKIDVPRVAQFPQHIGMAPFHTDPPDGSKTTLDCPCIGAAAAAAALVF